MSVYVACCVCDYVCVCVCSSNSSSSSSIDGHVPGPVIVIV